MSLPHPDPVTADAFILAGGHSSRMGRDKALIPLAGSPLIHHALGILRAAGLDPRIAGARSDLSSFAPTLPDDPTRSGLGPLSGICSALRRRFRSITLSSFPPTSRSCPPALSPIFSITLQSPNPR